MLFLFPPVCARASALPAQPGVPWAEGPDTPTPFAVIQPHMRITQRIEQDRTVTMRWTTANDIAKYFALTRYEATSQIACTDIATLPSIARGQELELVSCSWILLQPKAPLSRQKYDPNNLYLRP